MFSRALGLLAAALVVAGTAYHFLRKAPQSGSADAAQAKGTPAVGVVTEIPATGENTSSTLPPPTRIGPVSTDEVTVPDLSRYSIKETDNVLRAAGLVRSLVAARDKPPTKEKEFGFAGQTPAAGTKVNRGSTVTVSVYARFEGAAVSDEGHVPDLARYGSPNEIKAALASAGLTPSFVAAREKTPSKEKEFKLASQSPAPGTKLAPGSTVTLAFYQKYDGATAQSSQPPVTTPSATQTSSSDLSGDPFTGEWRGENMRVIIQKQGSGYVATIPYDRGDGVTATVTETGQLQGNKLALSSEDVTRTSDLKRKEGQKVGRSDSVYELQGSLLRRTSRYTNLETGKTFESGSWILTRK